MVYLQIRLSFKKDRKLIFPHRDLIICIVSLAIFRPHFVIGISPSAFYHPHFPILILSSAFFHPHFFIRIFPSAFFSICHPPSAAIRSALYRDPKRNSASCILGDVTRFTESVNFTILITRAVGNLSWAKIRFWPAEMFCRLQVEI